jgi:chromosome partitioning protein
MRNAITVMNAKGGVGKSTLTLTMAETLSVHHDKKVLVVDSDAHASISTMLISPDSFETIQGRGGSFVDYLIETVLKSAQRNWSAFVVTGVSDVDDARSIDLLLASSHLTLFEREVSKGNHETALRRAIRAFLSEARKAYDIVLIDSAPGLSLVTECWLREADFVLSPAKPDYLSSRGLHFLQQFGQRDAELGFAESLGVILSMKDTNSAEDERFEHWLRRNIKKRCFEQIIPRSGALQSAAYHCASARSFWAKYPGECGRGLRMLAAELLKRLDAAQMRTSEARCAEIGGDPRRG